MFVFFRCCAILEPQRRRICLIGFIIASTVTAVIIKGTVDITKQLRQTIRRRDEARRVREHARLHNISIREAHEILHND